MKLYLATTLIVLLQTGAWAAPIATETPPTAPAAGASDPSTGTAAKNGAHPLTKNITVPMTITPGTGPTKSEDWKGPKPANEFTVGFVAGSGLMEPSYGFGLLGNASKKLIPDGLIPDISNAVYLETELGPVLLNGSHPFFYSLHLRWDFQKDDHWTFFALAGAAGEITGSELGNRSLLFARLGLGMYYWITQNMSLRAEMSHEVIGAGLSFEF